MNENLSKLEAQAQELGKTYVTDHLARLLKAVISAVPTVGGPIASLIDDYIPESRHKRFEEFTNSLATELTRISSSLNEDYVKTDEFAFLFTRVYQNITRDYQKDKLDAYRNILVNALRVDLDASVQERYLFLVEQLSPMHLRVLSAFYSDSNNAPALRGKWLSSLSDTLNVLLPEVTSEHINRCIFDLDQLGITRQVASILMGTMTEHGATQLASRLTTFGREFLDFISDV